MSHPVTLAVLLFATAQDVAYPPRPGDREFILDQAELIDAADEQKIRGVCDKLLTDRAIPIVVATIPSLAQYGAGGWTIERYAHSLFDEWGVGHKERNFGILLLVSPGDRKARIELGAGWGGGKHAQSQEVMDDLIIPKFKSGDFTGGVVAGVVGLDAMARDLKLPTPAKPLSHYLLRAGFIGLAILTVVSLIRRGSSGWAWLFWGVIFSIVGYILYSALTSRGRGGGFGGGSFGGGFSGGGGATGSW